MKKVVFGVLAAAVIIFVMLNLFQYPWTLKRVQGDGAGVEKPVVKIGVSLPLSGQIAEIGNNCKEAALMAFEEADDAPIKFEAIIEDDAFSQPRTVVVANKLANVDKVQDIVSIMSGAGNIISPIADKHGVLHVSISNDPNAAKGDLNFSNWQNPSVAADRLAAFLKTKDVKKVAVFAANHISSESFLNGIRKSAKDSDIEVVEHSFMVDNKDFSTLVYKAEQDKDVDYWVLVVVPPALDIIRKEMIVQNVEVPVTSIQSIGISQNKDLFEGAYFVDAPNGSAEFVREIKKRISSENTAIPAYVYDTLKLLIKLNVDFYKENGRVATSEEVAEKLKNLEDYEGTVGALKVMQGGVISSKSVLKVVKDGKAILVEE